MPSNSHPTSDERLTTSNDGEFCLMKFVQDDLWRWSWMGATAGAGVTVEGMRGYDTQAGALTAARAARKRLIAYCKGLS